MLPTPTIKQPMLQKQTAPVCKPDSVGTSTAPPFISTVCRHTALSAYPPVSARATPAAARVYMAFQPTRFVRGAHCYTKPGALTTRFHPYRRCRRRLFSATRAVTTTLCPPVRWCGALSCPDFPHARELWGEMFFGRAPSLRRGRAIRSNWGVMGGSGKIPVETPAWRLYYVFT